MPVIQDDFGVFIKWLLIILAGVILVFLLVYQYMKKRKFQTDTSDALEGRSKHLKQSAAEDAEQNALLEKYPELKDAFVWLDKLLLTAKKQSVWIALRQRWCCEDREGVTDRPIRFCPSLIECRVGKMIETYSLDCFAEDTYFTDEEVKSLNKAIVARCKFFLPYRRYRLATYRTTRAFEVPDGFEPAWEETVIVKEEYVIEVS